MIHEESFSLYAPQHAKLLPPATLLGLMVFIAIITVLDTRSTPRYPFYAREIRLRQ